MVVRSRNFVVSFYIDFTLHYPAYSTLLDDLLYCTSHKVQQIKSCVPQTRGVRKCEHTQASQITFCDTTSILKNTMDLELIVYI